MNCARRTGEPKVESRPGQDIYWLPMTEANMQDACRSYLEEYGERLLEPCLGKHVYRRLMNQSPPQTMGVQNHSRPGHQDVETNDPQQST